MVNNLTFCILSTSARARVLTFISHTSSVGRTVSIDYTFRSAALIRIANILWKTRTWSSTILFSTNCICPTWRWLTRSRYFYNRVCCNIVTKVQLLFTDDAHQRTLLLKNKLTFNYCALNEWVSSITCSTETLWSVTNYSAFSICTTCVRTRICTLLVNTGKMTWAFSIANTFRSTVRRNSFKLM